MDEVRRGLQSFREEIRAGVPLSREPIESRVERSLARFETPSLRRVINATGVVLHTNLGRAPFPLFEPLFGYSNLEYDLAQGARGKRDVHVAELLERLVGAPGIAVNNNAAAIYLALERTGGGLRGGGFARRADRNRRRLPHSGHHAALGRFCARSEPPTAPELRIIATRSTSARACCCACIRAISAWKDLRRGRNCGELVALGKERGIPVYEDLGSGCVADLRAFGVDEPLVADSIRAGASLVSFSGDKLLGGPQAGILAGEPRLVTRLRRNPMFRALRLDKLISQALETTLRNLLLQRWDQIPALRMISFSSHQLRARAANFRHEAG